MTDAGPAFLLLAHENLARAGRFAARLAATGAPVAVHIDRRADPAPFRKAAQGAPLLSIPRRATPWGGFGLVAATLDGLDLLRRRGRPHSHVILVSGADLMLRPAEELRGFLAAHPGVDFIESVDPETAPWGRGFGTERFTLRHPVSWRDRRGLHDALCRLQRRAGLRRAPPPLRPPLVPRLGSQWWCLSRATCDAILDAPELPMLARWFRLTFLPDESFFATLAPRFAARPPDPRGPLTFARFDPGGRPYMLYDDHEDALAAGDHFFARKLWRGAGLDQVFPRPRGDAAFSARPPAIDFDGIEARAETPPRGLRHAGRAPLLRVEPEGALPRPCKAMAGLDALWGAEIAGWIGARCDLAMHGRVFAPDDRRGRFEGGEDTGPGGLRITPALLRAGGARLASCFVAAHRGRIPGLLVDPLDDPEALAALAEDPMTDLLALRGVWALADPPLSDAAAARAEAAERALLDRAAPARLTVLEAAEALADPSAALRRALAAARAPLLRDDGAPPPPLLAPAETLRARLQAMRARGFDVAV